MQLTEASSKKIIAIVALLASAFLLFKNLGHYSLWADEAMTAMSGKAVLATGDTTSWVENGNLVAYNNGHELINMQIRMMPPLPAFVTAASFGVFGVSTWSARLPFALAGLLTVALMLWWARRACLQYFIVLAIGIIGNASLFLYVRNCRYYALTVLFATLTMYCYATWHKGKGKLLVMALASVLVFASHYLAFVALYVCIGVDYFFWRRKEAKLSLSDWLTVLLPQVVFCGAIGWIWNPLRASVGNTISRNSIWDRFEIFLWNLRDANAVEFLVLPVILMAFFVAWRTKMDIKNPCRAMVSLLLAMLVVSFLTLQARAVTSVADVRYIVFLVPLGIALGAWAICVLLPGRIGWSVGLAAVAFFSNFLNGGMYFNWCGVRSTTYCYVRELLYPTNTDPFKETALWINKNIEPGKTVHVQSMINDLYPLMFHAPHVIYAWQLDDRGNPQFATLPGIHFKGEVMPDYLVGFGLQQVAQLQNDLKKYGRPGVEYNPVVKLDIFHKDLYRPELFWRTFTPIENYDKDRNGVFIFKRM